ncbi:MAG: hypothetical protein Q7S27_02025 [Nanoarchaeota archaeon]|nr:hypothetical protein [Nanoarchaeota archaeon]
MKMISLSFEERERIHKAASEKASEYMEKEGNALAQEIERKERISNPDMDENRVITFQNVRIQYASPVLVLRNYAFQEACAEEYEKRMNLIDNKNRAGLMSRLYRCMIKFLD